MVEELHMSQKGELQKKAAENPMMEQFNKFRKRIFEDEEGNNINGWFYHLVELVDIRAEKLKMPSYMCQHKD